VRWPRVDLAIDAAEFVALNRAVGSGGFPLASAGASGDGLAGDQDSADLDLIPIPDSFGDQDQLLHGTPAPPARDSRDTTPSTDHNP
jgi:hypothetical protein